MNLFRALKIVLYCIVLLSYAVGSRPLTYGVNHYPPFIIFEENTVSGIDIEILVAITKRLKLDLEIYNCPWKRCLEMVEQGCIDVLTTLNKTDEREKYIAYVTPPYYEDKWAFYLNKNSQLRIDNYEELKSLMIGFRRGTSHFSQFDADKSLNKYVVNADVELIKMLTKGRLDTIIGSQAIFDYLIQKEGFGASLVKAEFNPSNAFDHIGISRKSSYLKLLPRFNKAMLEIIESGEIKRIMKNFSLHEPVNRFRLKVRAC